MQNIDIQITAGSSDGKQQTNDQKEIRQHNTTQHRKRKTQNDKNKTE